MVLVALGLFVGGLATGGTALYWACVAVSAVAAVLLVVARRRLGRPGREPAEPAVESGDAPIREEQPLPDAVVPTAVPQTAGDGVVTDTAQLVPDLHEPDPSAGRASGAHAVDGSAPAAAQGAGDPPGDEDPPVEEVEVSDLLLVVDLTDEVFVVDEHPRYHVPGCPWLRDRATIPLPVDEARTDGFTPCGRCAPDRHLAGVERARRAERGTG